MFCFRRKSACALQTSSLFIGPLACPPPKSSELFSFWNLQLNMELVNIVNTVCVMFISCMLENAVFTIHVLAVSFILLHWQPRNRVMHQQRHRRKRLLTGFKIPFKKACQMFCKGIKYMWRVHQMLRMHQYQYEIGNLRLQSKLQRTLQIRLYAVSLNSAAPVEIWSGSQFVFTGWQNWQQQPVQDVLVCFQLSLWRLQSGFKSQSERFQLKLQNVF